MEEADTEVDTRSKQRTESNSNLIPIFDIFVKKKLFLFRYGGGGYGGGGYGGGHKK